MKKMYLLPVALIIFFAVNSCEKYDFKRDLSGSWIIYQVSGGLYPHQSPFNFTKLRISSNDTWVIYNHDTLMASGTVSIYRSSHSYDPSLEDYYIKFNKGEPFYKEPTLPLDEELDVEFLHNDTLILSQRNVADGYQYYFAK